MKNLLKLFSVLQLTKEQPLTGYVIGGIKLHELPTLAEHQYSCALMGYFLCQKIKKSGGQIDRNKVILMLLLHDLSELFGGDVSAPLNRKYPDLRKHKNLIGERAIEMLAEYLDPEASNEFIPLFSEMDDGVTDESMVVKIIDQMDHQMFLEHNNFRARYNPGVDDYRPKFIKAHVQTLIDKLKNPETKKVMNQFLETFKEQCYNKGFQSITILLED